MKVAEVNFSVPSPPPGTKELHHTRSIKQGKCKHPGTQEDLNYSIEVDLEQRLVYIGEVNSGELAAYPFETISRLRIEK